MSENQDIATPEVETQIERGNPAGELKLLALLMIIGLALFIDSFKLNGIFQGASNGSGTIAQLVALSLILLLAGRSYMLIKDPEYKEGTWQDVKKYLFDQQVVIMIVMIILYGAVVEYLHFVPTSIIFLVATMYLLERKNIVRKAIISCIFVGCLYGIFTTAFQVVLP